ncbi:terminase large subunit domain-containing protein [Phycicoccus duodecadis]|uniref:Terminase family protein n=1 Tax=Phycicoccus duodecadis TaxID=173053 RepID=A0A2N3YEX6_9MICO|nr:terminase family protein [Phycicoccus duodecadis]PKW25407.1 terminase family protein [Phycicoccus duodecadis]
MTTTAALTAADYDEARRDPVVFAALLLGDPLWDHQVEVVRSSARYRVLCAGRRSGKTRVFGVLSLHRAFAVPRSRVLIVSASDRTAKRMFADVLGMVTGALGLASSVDDETTHMLTLSNGSTIECVPSSMKAVRSAEADLLIVDEAGFVDQGIWEAAEPVVGARPGARVLIASSPWRGPGHFFHDLWRQGMDHPDTEVASWHWPSSISPLVDRVWLEAVRGRSALDYFRREYLAEWTGESGAYFSEAELMASVADYEMTSPEAAALLGFPGMQVGGGIDWGFSRDANAVVYLGVLDDLGLNMERKWRLFVPWLEARHRWEWSDFIDYLCEGAKGYDVRVYASEANGVGAYPSDDLAKRLWEKHRLPTTVAKVWTDVRRKQSGFGMVKSLLGQGRLVLPRHPELLKQLRGLEFEQTQTGQMRISVPERSGHDDLAMALLQAVSTVHPRILADGVQAPRRFRSVESVSTTGGVVLPRRPLPSQDLPWCFSSPKGREKGDLW